MLKKTLLVILLLFIIIVAVFFAWRFISYLNDPDPDKTFILPRVEIAMVAISSLTAEKTELATSVLIRNQMPFSFTADSIQYSIYVNDIEMIRSSYKKSLRLERNDTSWISLPMTFYNQGLDSLIKVTEGKEMDSVNYRVKASFYTDIIFKRKFDVDIHRYLPLVHIPEVKTEQLEVDSLNFSGAAILLHVSFINNNLFPIQAKDIDFEFEIEKNEIIKGTIPGYTIIQARSTNKFAIPVNVYFKKGRKSLYDLLRSNSIVNYYLHLRLKIVSNKNMLDNSIIILKSEGSVKSLMKVVKNNP